MIDAALRKNSSGGSGDAGGDEHGDVAVAQVVKAGGR